MTVDDYIEALPEPLRSAAAKRAASSTPSSGKASSGTGTPCG